jgi:HemY protein
MIRLILFLAILAIVALGLSWLADRPGELVLTWQGMRIETSVLVGLAAMAAVSLAAILLWSVIRFIFRLPSLVSLTTRARRRNKGHAALARGMIAAAAGDRRYALRATREAEKLLGEEPLTLLLRAQSAQLEGDRQLAEATFERMVARPETRLLGLRGLHAEATRRNDEEAAHHYAAQAHRIAPLGWTGEALLSWHVRRADWHAALDIVETNRTHKVVTREQADRQRAVLLTARAREHADREPDSALKDAREANKLAPDLVPAAVLAGQLLGHRGDLRKAARLLEAAWRLGSHPDIAQAYVHLRPGDAAKDRLARAVQLSALTPGAQTSRIDQPNRQEDGALALARAALEARDFDKARKALAPLMSDETIRPSQRLCLAMADIEETEHGAQSGPAREWLSRALRAPRDPAWIADGILSDRWEPAAPGTGKLDAFRWAIPQDRLGAPPETIILAPTQVTTAVPDAVPASMPAAPPATPREQATAPPALIEAEPLQPPAPLAPRRARPIVPGGALYPMPISPDDPGPDGTDEKPRDERSFP